jgi:hypothetical protein
MYCATGNTHYITLPDDGENKQQKFTSLLQWMVLAYMPQIVKAT